MERIRIDKASVGLRMRHRDARDAARAESTAPLRYAAPGGGADLDEDLLARIGDLLAGPLVEDEDEA